MQVIKKNKFSRVENWTVADASFVETPKSF